MKVRLEFVSDLNLSSLASSVGISVCMLTDWLTDWLTSVRRMALEPSVFSPWAHKGTYPVDAADYASSLKRRGTWSWLLTIKKWSFTSTPPLHPVSWCSDEGATPEDCCSSSRTLHTTICSWQKPRVFKQLLLLCHQITSDLSHRQAVLFMFHMQYCSYMMESMPRPRQDSFLSLHLLSQLFCHQCSLFILVFSFMLIYLFALQFLLRVFWIGYNTIRNGRACNIYY